MADEWYYAQQGQQHGPVTAGQLKQLAQSGRLLPTDLVWKQGMANWAPASSARGLFPQAPVAANIAPGSRRTAAPSAAPASSRNAAASAVPVAGKPRPGPVHVTPIDDEEDEAYDEAPRSRRVQRSSRGLGTGAWIAIIGGSVGAVVLVVILLVVFLRPSGRTGSETFVETVTPGVHSYTITFKGGQAAHFSIAGQGNSDVEIYVFDRHNRLVTSNFLGQSDRRNVTWLPPETETYRIDLKNNGPHADRLTIVHN